MNAIPRPPHDCGVKGCGAPADVYVLLARRMGKQYAGRFSDYGIQKGEEWFCKEGYEFSGWVSRCGWHYLQDVQNYGGSALKVVSKD